MDPMHPKNDIVVITPPPMITIHAATVINSLPTKADM